MKRIPFWRYWLAEVLLTMWSLGWATIGSMMLNWKKVGRVSLYVIGVLGILWFLALTVLKVFGISVMGS